MNLTPRRVRVTIVAIHKQEVLRILSVSVVLIRQTNAPHYSAICGLTDSAIFFHIISQTARFPEKKKLLNIKHVLIFSTSYPKYVILKQSATYYLTCT